MVSSGYTLFRNYIIDKDDEYEPHLQLRELINWRRR